MDPKLIEIANYLKNNPQEARGHIYHPLPFMEFSDLKTSSNPKSALKKWELIKRSLPKMFDFSNARVLDVGANLGFYSMSFSLLNAEVDAYEPNDQYFELGEKISNLKRLKIHWYNKPLEINDINNKNYDIVLMLSVFQWISQGNERLAEATNLLEEVLNKSHILYFELGCNKGKSAINIKEPSILWIWKLLNDHSDKFVYYLGSSSAWRGGNRYMFACSDFELNLKFWQKFVTKFLSQISR
jgi:hypothetical protein